MLKVCIAFGAVSEMMERIKSGARRPSAAGLNKVG